ncbi:unnamed protein product, partial [Mesorhabditis spiculigera]
MNSSGPSSSAGSGGGGGTPGPLKLSLKLGGAKISTRYASQGVPFYTLKPDLPGYAEQLGSTDLLEQYDLATPYQRLCTPGKVKEDLESFLPNLYGNFHFSQSDDFSSLRRLVEKPPITGKEIAPLTTQAMSGFRLNVGPVDEAYRHLFTKKRDNETPAEMYLKMDKTPAEIVMPIGKNGKEKRKKEHKEHKEKKDKKKKKEKKKKHAMESSPTSGMPDLMDTT